MNNTTMKQVFDDLESNNPELVEAFKTKIREQFRKTNDPWLMNGVYDYHLRTQSQRAVDVLANVSEPHDGFFLKKMVEGLKGPTTRLQHLSLLGYLVRRRPMWIYKIFQHEVLAQLLYILKVESEIVTIVSALLILNILIPLVPISVGSILPDIFSVFSKLAARNCNSNNYQDAQLVHLQISLYTLFHRLYGMFPNNFINFLRKEYMTNETYPVFSHTVKPMLDTVRVNHLLITGDENWEKSSERWRNVEPHDIIVGCANLLMNGGNSGSKEFNQRNVYEPKAVFNCGDLLGVVKVTGKQTVAEYCKELGKGADDPTLLSPSVRFLENRPPESVPAQIPLTPIIRGFEVSSPYSEHEGSSPPEAAVEATPETTPIRECLTTTNASGLFSAAGRPLASFIKDHIQQGAIVPMSERSFPTSPIKKDSPTVRHSAPEIILHGSQLTSSRKINMLLTDRNQASDPNNVIELKPIVSDAAKNTNDLISENRTQSVISSVNTSKSVNCVSDRKENGTASVEKSDVAPDSVEEFDPCALEKSGSPCSSGGLHMPDQKLMGNFALYMQHMRHRQHSQCTSDSERFSPSNSPQDRVNYFKNSKVRRTNSCPEMKKDSPNSTTLSSDSPVLEERDENEEFYDNKKYISTRRKSKKSTPTKVTVETQTEDLPSQPQYPYEHLFLDVFPPLHPPADGQSSPTASVNSLEERAPLAKVFEKVNTPSKLLQTYIDTAASCFDDRLAIRDTSRPPSIVLENKYLLDQLRLMGVALQLEEHKREVHAERNRRLLPRSRRNKTLEEHNNILIAQVTDLQKQVKHCQEEVTKIIHEKEALIEQEKRNCTHWRTQFGTLQQEHKTLTSRYQNVEALLKEERDSNEQNLKQLNDTRATLCDITNDLESCRKDAMEAKDLRRTIAELQHEMTKAGELITLYRNRLIEACLPTDDKVTTESTIHSLIDERNRLMKIISDQRISLEATQKTLDLLRKNTKDKENQVGVLSDESVSSQETLETIIKDWKKKYEEMKASYDQEKIRSANLESQVNRCKLLMKSNNTKIAAQKDTGLRRGLIPLADDGGGSSGAGLKPGPSVPKSPKTFAHSASQQVKLTKESEKFPSPVSDNTNRSRTSPPNDQSNERESPSRAQVENPPSPATTTLVGQGSVDGDGSGSGDVFKSIVKKKGRTECAETGQLRPISFTQFDPEPPTRKE
ncbi:hamartin isoform X2 [Planococcus citri]|uniref:hamartin isoform X2 n=1 Tax=Planococcus citri TaxID=170843 RepID=UPI0031F9B073